MFYYFKSLIKHSLIYGLATSFQAGINFLLVPIYTRWLKAEGFGELEILNSFLQILMIIISLGFGSAIVKVYILDVERKKERDEVLKLALLITLPFSLLAFLFLFIYSAKISGLLLGRTNLFYLIYLIALINIFLIYNNLYFGFLRAKDQSKKYLAGFLLRGLIIAILNIYFVISLNLGVKGVLLGILGGQILLTFFFIGDTLKSLKITSERISSVLKFKIIKKLFKFGIPIMPASLAMFIISLSDRYFLRFMADIREVGIYSLGYKIGLLVFILVVAPLQLSWPTFSFKMAKIKKEKKIFAKTLTYFLIIGLFLSLILSLFSKEVISILATSEFISAYKIVPLICLSYLFLGAHYLLVPGLHLKEKTKYYPLIIIIPAFLNLGLNYLFIKQYGITGAAMATIISFFIMALLTYFISNYFYPIKYEWYRIIEIFSLWFLFLLVPSLISIFILPLKFIAPLGFLVLIYLTVLTKTEQEKIKNLLAYLLNYKIKKPG